MRPLQSFSVFLILSAMIFESHPGFAEEQERGDFETVGHHAKSTFVDAFDSTGVTLLLAGGVVTLLAFSQDQSMHDTWKDYQRMNADAAKFGNFWGTGAPEAAIAITQIIFDKKNGIPSAEGLLASTGVTYAIKFATARPRPDSDTRTSFPSGHSQIAFASATSIMMSYGWWASVPSYGLAVFTGLSRLADNAHWFSDVVAGATVGAIFGRAGFKHHFTVAPMAMPFQDRGFGLVASFEF